MYGDKCERCGGVEGVDAVGLVGMVPVILCLKCRRDFDDMVRATGEWDKHVEAGGVFYDMKQRAMTADANDIDFWAGFASARKAYAKMMKALRQRSLAWVEAECDAPKKGNATDADRDA